MRKVENLLGSDGRKYRRVMEQDFHWNFRVNSKWFFAFFSGVLDWIVFIVVLFERSPPPPPPPPLHKLDDIVLESLSFTYTANGKRTSDSS